jgi:hypothetical protein
MELLGICLVCGLATWRLASLLHTEDAFEWLRTWIGIRNDENGYPVQYPDGFWGDVFNCFWCLSLFAGALLSIVTVLAARLDAVWILLVWLGSSAFAIWLEKQIMRTQSR